MSNIKEVIINPNKPADVKFVQYDTGQKLSQTAAKYSLGTQS